MSFTDNPKDNVDWVNNYALMDFTNPETPHNRVLVVGETKFYVNAEHLSLCSEFFRTMFNSDFKEKDQKEIEIKDVDAAGFHSFLKLLHPLTINPVTKDNYGMLLAYCHRFLARDAFGVCESFVLTNIKDLNLVDLLKLAFKFKWDKLKNKLQEVMTESRKCKHCDSLTVSGCFSGHQNHGICLLRESPVVKNKAHISELPTEIQAFVLQAFMNAA